MFSSEVDYIVRKISPTPVPLLYLTVMLVTAENLHTLEHSKETPTNTHTVLYILEKFRVLYFSQGEVPLEVGYLSLSIV